MMQYLTWDNLLFVGLVVAVIAVLYGYGYVKREDIFKWIEEQIVLAEAYYNTEAGKKVIDSKLEYVINEVHKSLPLLAQKIFTKAKLRVYVEEVWDYIKEKVVDEAGVEHTVPTLEKAKYI